MNNIIINAKIADEAFPVVIGPSALIDLRRYLQDYDPKSVIVIADRVFADDRFASYYDLIFLKNVYNCFFIDGGIESKEIETYLNIIKKVDSLKLPKDGIIVALGGGVIGDLVAFVASTYLRGVRLIHLPTTTTAMIDSSIGGKTALNHLSQVNLIGTYYNPIATFMDTRFLLTLPNRDYYSGLCEALKMSITSDISFLDSLESSSIAINRRSIPKLNEIVKWSVLTKLRYVSEDQKEQSQRLVLNYGHTFGQCIESFYGLYQDNLRHGEAVSLGILIAASCSNLIYRSSESSILLERTLSLLSLLNLPTSFSSLKLPNIPDTSDLVSLLINDKKRLAKGNRFILCDQIGSANIVLLDNSYIDILEKSFTCIYSN